MKILPENFTFHPFLTKVIIKILLFTFYSDAFIEKFILFF